MKKWKILIGIFLACLLLGTSAAMAGGIIRIPFGGGVTSTGTIHVVAPDPTVNDLVVTVPDLTFYTTGGGGNAVISVSNNSSWDLIFQSIAFTYPEAICTIQAASDYTGSVLPAGGSHDITIFYSYVADIQKGDYEYSGTIEYSW